MPTFIEFLLQFRIGNCQRKGMILVFHCCVISYFKPSNFRQVTPKEWFKMTPLYYLIFFCGSKSRHVVNWVLLRRSIFRALFSRCQSSYIFVWSSGSMSKFTGYLQNSIPCGCKAEDSVFLWDINQGTFSGPSYIAFSTIWQFALMRPAGNLISDPSHHSSGLISVDQVTQNNLPLD